VIHIKHSKAYASLGIILFILIIFSFIFFFYDSNLAVSSGGGEGGGGEGGEGEGGHIPVCGNGVINTGEQCERPSTANNGYCSQATSTCSGNQTGTRDSYGNCGSTCLCSYDPFTYSCVKNSCGAQCSVNSDCPNKCVGNVRYFNGACGPSSCSCSFQTENCDNSDGWYNTTEKQWVNLDVCREKEQLKQEYRDYSCAPGGCTYAVTGYQWIDTGNTRNKPDGTNCGTNTTSCQNDYCLGLVFYDFTFNSCNRLCLGGSCGSCNTCSLTTQACTASGCCDATCNSLTGCGSAKNNNNCQPYCLDNVRYFSGTCGAGCSCSYQTENCDNLDGWYNTSETQFIPVNSCTEKEQLKQEYRDYSCAPGQCTYVVTNYQWVDTGVSNYLPPATSCGTNTTICPKDKCSALTFFDWTCSTCTRYCDGYGDCGTCSSCSLITQACTASGCCDATCNSLTGCGSVKNNNNCQPYCLDNVRYFSGTCTNDCSCSYATQDCNALSGWKDTNQKTTGPCDDNPCQICTKVKQQYNQCTCTPSKCNCKVTSTRLVEIDRKDVVCTNGKVCQNGKCVYTCEGFVQLTFTRDPYCPDTDIVATISGLSHCNNKIAYLKEDSCDGTILGQCRVGSSSCTVNFRMSEVGTHQIVACVDKDSNGNFNNPGEQVSSSVKIDCHSCTTRIYCNSKSSCNGWCLASKTCLNVGESC